MKLKATVVSTVFNGEKYFDRSIPSILNQTINDYEYIILDDGSEDNTLKFLRKIEKENSNFKVVSLGRLGRAKALNAVVNMAKGDVIFQQDFDDISAPDRIERQLAEFEANPRLGVLGGNYEIYDENRNEKYIRIVPNEHKNIVNSFSRYIPLAHTIAAFRKEAWVAAGGYPEISDIEDLMLWARIVKCGWLIQNLGGEPLGVHFVHPKSFWHRSFDYKFRQRALIRCQLEVINNLSLPRYLKIYPFARYLYMWCPDFIKRILRRMPFLSKEVDLKSNC